MLHLRTLGQLDRVQIIAAVTLLVSFFKDSIKDWLWKIYEEPGKLWSTFLDHYKPQDGSTTILKFITSQESEFSASKTIVGMGLVVLCISAIVEGLLLFLTQIYYAIDGVSEGISSNFTETFQQYASITE